MEEVEILPSRGFASEATTAHELLGGIWRVEQYIHPSLVTLSPSCGAAKYKVQQRYGSMETVWLADVWAESK
jgi:hypothetical protein